MKIERRKFLGRALGFVAGGLAAKFGLPLRIARTLVVAPASVVAPVAVPVAAIGYGAAVRAQVFEVIVRQAAAGAPWKIICDGPMQVNNISPADVEAEVVRRYRLLDYSPDDLERRIASGDWVPEVILDDHRARKVES